VAVRIEAFDPGLHDTKDFRSGSDSQDNFLRRTAKRQQRDGYTRVYVATDAAQAAEPRPCLGFYAINAHAIGVAEIPGDAAPRPPRSNLIPGVFLSHLAVDGRVQGKGLGRILLVDAMQQCQRAGHMLEQRNALASTASTHRWGSGPCQDDRNDCSSLCVSSHLCNRADKASEVQMLPAPARDRGFHVLQVPLQRAPALGAAPAAVVLAWGEHPPQPQLAEGFPAHPQGSARFCSRHPDPLAGWRCGCVHQAPPSWARKRWRVSINQERP
jgi:GNAT superfamily N-acetyltransferase